MAKKKSYVLFVERPELDSRGYVKDRQPKTKKWEVTNTSSVTLGKIKWFSRWRQYTFFPANDTVFSTGCWEEIMAFILKQTELHRKLLRS